VITHNRRDLEEAMQGLFHNPNKVDEPMRGEYIRARSKKP